MSHAAPTLGRAVPRALGTERSTGASQRTGRYLPARAVLAVDADGARVDCLEGEVWVTGPGLGDEVLASGEGVEVREPGRVVVQALVPSRIRVVRLP